MYTRIPNHVVAEHLANQRIKKHITMARKIKAIDEDDYSPREVHIEICDKRGEINDGGICFL